VGKPFFSPEVVELLLEDHVQRMRREGTSDSYDLLTERDREVLQLLAEGKTNKEAAAVLGLGTGTIETHRHNLMQKLNLHNTAELVVYAVKKKILRI
jgi:DNA-binding NarL/FixJ family response regulator